MSPQTKGFLLKDIVKIVEAEKGPVGLAGLAEKFGPLEFYSMKEYPMEDQIRLVGAACEVLFGKNDGISQFNLGKLVFSQSFSRSLIGKIVMTTMKRDDIKETVMHMAKTLEKVHAKEGFLLTVESGEGNRITATVENSTHDPNYLAGVLVAAIEYYGYTPNVTSSAVSRDKVVYTLEW